MNRTIGFRLNGKPTTLDTNVDRKLLWVLRTDLGLTGTKYGCGVGLCGACTVLVDGKAVRSCHTALESIENKDVVTIEGLAQGGKLHPMQEAFVEHGGFQCGYCTPGMIMTCVGLLHEQPAPTHDAIAKGLEQNLCRCGAHQRILAAVEAVVQGKGGQP
jgi:aerobic-type carbon monoxide dehydrogenase small subunit (CoxS/CutS family)